MGNLQSRAAESPSECVMHLVQLNHRHLGRRVALVDEPRLSLLESATSIYQLARDAIQRGESMVAAVNATRSHETLNYDHVYTGQSDWKLLPAFDHPDDPAHCLV